jgi:hypothetical protein
MFPSHTQTLRLLSELEANRPLMRKVELMGSIKKLLESRTSTPAAKSSAKKVAVDPCSGRGTRSAR